jgi:hypothetical protein
VRGCLAGKSASLTRVYAKADAFDARFAPRGVCLCSHGSIPAIPSSPLRGELECPILIRASWVGQPQSQTQTALEFEPGFRILKTCTS